MVMVYMGGHISGGHYNPAVTLAVLIRGKMDFKTTSIYWLAQLLGGVLAVVLTGMLVQDDAFTFKVAPAESASVVQALLVEIIFTFALALVVLNTATSKRTEGNSYYGLAIGFTMMMGLFAGGNISGGAFNPAIGICPNLVNLNFPHIWLYILGPFIGGALAGFVFKIQHPGEA
ncbi:UNVERIFIED_CONTAM: hypothetical protein GTU68_011551 [Idotea baltica]|nr:hypothetical protein [Idotea baltica]